MKIPTLINRGRGGFNMTPMIDVVFLLIIFFLVSSHLARQESRIPLELPLADSGIDQTASPVADVLTINVMPDGRWQIAGSDVDRTQLDRVLGEHRGSNGDEATVRIRTNRDVPYRHVSPILESIAANGLWNAAFAVYPKE